MGRPHDLGKRKSILESAFQVFGEFGFQRTTMKMIAQRAGIAPGSIYIYFRDKESLFKSTVEEGWDQFLSEFQRLSASPQPFRERLAVVLDLGFRKLKEGLPLLQGMLFEANQRRLLHTKLERLCGDLERLFGEGLRQRIPDKTLIRVTVMGILFSAALASPEHIDQEIETLKTMLARQLAERLRGEGNP